MFGGACVPPDFVAAEFAKVMEEFEREFGGEVR